MDATKLKELEMVLRARRQKLRDEILQKLTNLDDGPMSELHGRVHDAGEESIADMLADVSIASLEQAGKEVAGLEQALTRIADGTYGSCMDCSEKIEMDRLKANPAAKRCYTCQSKREDNRSSRDSSPSL